MKRYIIWVIIPAVFFVLSGNGCKKHDNKSDLKHFIDSTQDSSKYTSKYPSLSGFHRWVGTIISESNNSPYHTSGNCIMQFNISIQDDTTIICNDDTLMFDKYYSSADTLRFAYSWKILSGRDPHYTSDIIYNIKTKKITYSRMYGHYYMIYKQWDINVHDTNISIPISLLKDHTHRIAGSRFWTVHRTYNIDDTTMPFTVDVIDDSTIKFRSFWILTENSELTNGNNNLILNYTSSDSISQSITYRSNYYILDGGSLTYYYAKDSMAYHYVRATDIDPWYDFYLNTP